MPPPNNKRSNGRDGPVNRWHRNTAIAAVVGLLYLLATGIPLQFSTQLGLGHTFVTQGWVLDWYGLQAPTEVKVSGEVAHIGGLLFLGDVPAGQLDDLAGYLDADGAGIVAGGRSIMLVHASAPEHPERIDVGATVLKLGEANGRYYVATTEGPMAADPALLNWSPVPALPPTLQWAEVAPLQGAAADRYRQAFRARMLNVERWLLDLHSGRFFGDVGVLAVDVVSLLLIVLAITGLILWARYPRKRS